MLIPSRRERVALDGRIKVIEEKVVVPTRHAFTHCHGSRVHPRAEKRVRIAPGLDLLPELGKVFRAEGKVEVLGLVVTMVERMLHDQRRTCECVTHLLDRRDVDSRSTLRLQLNAERFDHDGPRSSGSAAISKVNSKRRPDSGS